MVGAEVRGRAGCSSRAAKARSRSEQSRPAYAERAAWAGKESLPFFPSRETRKLPFAEENLSLGLVYVLVGARGEPSPPSP
jgi:hypothetical protein